jgi:hypothetical protein
MNNVLLIFFACYFYSCEHLSQKESESNAIAANSTDTIPGRSYEQIKKGIQRQRKIFSANYSSAGALTAKSREELIDFWVTAISHDLFKKWENTPWDFNGITQTPQQGAIACGYFVTTMLQDMDVKLNRVKLSTCASSEMMKSLTPGQRIRNLSPLNYIDFTNTMKSWGKGVYIIGLDYHTGFIVNDGTETWFII